MQQVKLKQKSLWHEIQNGGGVWEGCKSVGCLDVIEIKV